MSSLSLNIFPGLKRTITSNNILEDSLARQSDVIVSTEITPYSEYRGFFIYVITTLALVLWALWTLIPDRILEETFYIYYYPDKYWATAIPIYFLLAMLYAYVAVALYNTEKKTLLLSDIRNFVDDYSVYAGETNLEDYKVEDSNEFLWKAPSGVWDLPITLVNEVLYLDEEDI